ncbi:MAG: biosynthetic-type acetolactate synthase large subunit [Dehalococcoidia bacterium]|nr:biosynthetic-type acetolactate synthase large subunit [Dehalococcoidia bacterium]
MKMTGAQILCESLVREGVEVVFGFPGGAVLPLYDTLPQYPQLRHILVRHEQGAAHAADGYARVTGKVGVCFATSGPGATNLVTGIANAHLDSIPMVAITGQVARQYIGKDGFQEVDIIGITVPITKHNSMVYKADDLAKAVKEAFHIARTGRPGPVLIDIPKDVFEEQANFNYPAQVNLTGYHPVMEADPLQLEKAAKLINEAKRPVIIAGHGVIISGAYKDLRELAEKSQIPVVNTLLGIGCFPESHVLSFGMLGMHGMAYANMAVDASDLIIAIGMRFDDRATSNVSGFARGAYVIHIDIDPAEIGKNLKVTVPVVGDAQAVLEELNKKVESQSRIDWVQQIEQWRQLYPTTRVRETEDLLPQYVIRQIYEVTEGKATIVTGVGQHQMWSAHHYWYDKPNSFVSSGGLGTMGFELPAAIGAKVGLPDDIVWAICGDGGFQMTIQELGTMVQDNIGVKIAIMNNGYLGMVRQWQELFYKGRYVATPLSNPDFIKVAEAYGIPAVRVESKMEVIPAIKTAIDTPGPFLIDFRIEPEENVYPMVAPGTNIGEIIKDPKCDDIALPGKQRL